MELKVHKITNSKRGEQNITAERFEKDLMDDRWSRSVRGCSAAAIHLTSAEVNY